MTLKIITYAINHLLDNKVSIQPQRKKSHNAHVSLAEGPEPQMRSQP